MQDEGPVSIAMSVPGESTQRQLVSSSLVLPALDLVSGSDSDFVSECRALSDPGTVWTGDLKP